MLAIKGSKTVAILTLILLVWTWSRIPQVSAAEDFDSLYSAIAAANAGGESAIILTEDITLGGALPAITGRVTIDGAGHSISGDGKYRIFDVNGGRLGISDLTLTEGKAPASEDGGAILLRSGGEAIVSDAAFINNEAENGGALYLSYASAAIANSSFAGNRAHSIHGYGGAVKAQYSSITIAKSSFVANRSGSRGGAIDAWDSEINITNSTFHKNRTGFGAGGVLSALYSDATLTHLTMVSNWARSEGGDAILRGGGSVKLRNSIIVDGGIKEDCVGGLNQNIGNLSRDGTCGLDASDDPRLDGPVGSPVWFPLLDRSPAVDAANPEYCLETDQIGTLRPQGGNCDIGAIESMTASAALPTPVPPLVCTLSDQIKAANTDAEAGACPAGNGADIITLTKDHNLQAPLPQINSHITIEGNGYTISGDNKYRVFRVDGGKLTINDLTLSDGFAKELGGAIRLQGGSEVVANDSRFLNNSAKEGGAIASNSEASRVHINKSSFVGNRASSYGGAIMLSGGDLSVTDSSFVENAANARYGHGGAIDASYTDTVDISSSTFIGNRAFRGGAVSAGYAFAVTLTHVTLLNNQASLGAGLWIAEDGPNTVKLRNSIIAGGIGNNCQGPLAQNTGNLIDDASCSPMLSGDPMLDEPAGDPVYLSLQVGSPAINAAHPAFCPATDQIGTARPQGGGCDIGAIEWSAGGAAQAESGSVSKDLSGCAVTTTHVLNFRDGPDGTRFGTVPQNSTVTATARTAGWFQVEYRGRTGWISADYVVAEGDCG